MTETITITHDRQLDALIAERVLGVEVIYELGNYYFKTENGGAWLYQYSTNIAAAWQVIKMFESNWEITVHYNPVLESWTCILQQSPQTCHAASNQLPLAICLAALRSLDIEVNAVAA